MKNAQFFSLLSMTTPAIHLVFGWGSILFGVLSGGLIGLFFHREDWAGGYGSFRRRMLRLGHIAFLGMGLLNLAFALTLNFVPMDGVGLTVASLGFFIGGLGMPICCFLTAWKKSFRHLFPVPVFGILTGVGILLTTLLL